ncbi:MAG: electron transfer flavoprotein subunit beta, partial [Cellulomonadaceae bacterium]|nr:electron transfer flavoprotein subunit beta [Cellulomonadaceae bacterium]
MTIVVCVKHVPDLQSDRRFTEAGLVDRSQGDGTLNELDESAVEAALVLAESLD